MKKCMASLLFTGLLVSSSSLVCIKSKSVFETINQNYKLLLKKEGIPQKKVEVVSAPTFISTLRNKNTAIHKFRDASDTLGVYLAATATKYFPIKKISLETQLASCDGYEFKNGTVLIPILRSGLALLNPFLSFFKKSKVGNVGLVRDEETAKPSQYYLKIPKISPTDTVLILDPMLATGGSSSATIKLAIENGAKEENIIFVGVIAATDGIKRILKDYPNIKKIIVTAIDPVLNTVKFIVPGLGDYGDRYFGTEDE